MYTACAIIGSQLLWTFFILSSKNLDDKKIKGSYSNLYIGCDTKNKLGILYFPFQRARMFLFIMIGALLFQYQVLEIVIVNHIVVGIVSVKAGNVFLKKIQVSLELFVMRTNNVKPTIVMKL